MKIIKCKIENLDKLALFYDDVTTYLDQNINYPKWVKGSYPGRESTQKAILKGEQYACFDNDTVVGAFIFNDDPQGAYEVGDWSVSLAGGEYMVIHTLAVHPSFYGKGIAKEMVNFCLDEAKKRGKKAVRLDVVPDNIPAKTLYEKCGFSLVGEYDLKRNINYIPTFLLLEKNL